MYIYMYIAAHTSGTNETILVTGVAVYIYIYVDVREVRLTPKSDLAKGGMCEGEGVVCSVVLVLVWYWY